MSCQSSRLRSRRAGASAPSLGEKRFRAVQLFRWIHQKGQSDFRRCPTWRKSLRDKLRGLCRGAAAVVRSARPLADGTVKWLFDVGGGNAVETVFIPETDRGTLCVSSQAGCAVGCRFCSTGHQGFSRNLSTARSWPNCGMPSTAARGGWAWPKASVPSQCRDDGHGRAAAELRGAGAGAARHARRPRLRPVAPPRHGVHLGHGAHDRPPARRLPGGPGRVAARRRRCPARPAGAAEPQVPAGRTARTPAVRYLEACAARLHHLRVLHARRRQRCARHGGTTRRPRWRPGPGALAGQVVPCKFNLIPFNPFPQSGLRRSGTDAVRRFADVLQRRGW
jgi:23S rRNA (adenine2503-C2)-methyltransferase